MDALSAAGIPVYVERGPGGGCSLMDGYQTHLTRLSRDEIKALFMLSMPASLDELGMSRELKTALDKLAAALPPQYRQDDQMVHQRVYLDWTEGTRGQASGSLLPLLYQSVRDNRRLDLTYWEYLGPLGRMHFERRVEPWGLVAGDGDWRLVAADAPATPGEYPANISAPAGHPEDALNPLPESAAASRRIRIYPVARLLRAVPLDERFERPADFDLAAYWKEQSARRQQYRTAYPVTVRFPAALAADLTELLMIDRQRLTRGSPVDDHGFIQSTLVYENLEDARRRLLALGGALEVLEPEALRRSMIDFALQITSLYSQ